MNETTAKRRIWIRNIVIIFLAVLLLLTFFSQTILNYSLPEVSVRYPNWGTITSRVQVSGTVRANQTYDVTIPQTRKIENVLVRVGQRVEKGTVLMTLTDGGSAELAAAQKLYDDLTIQLIGKVKADPSSRPSATADTVRELTEALASLEKQYAAIVAEKGKIPTIAEMNEAKTMIGLEKANIEALTEEIDRLNGKRGQTGGSGYYTDAELSALIDKAKAALAKAETAALAALNAQLSAEASLSQKKAQLAAAGELLKAAQKAVSEYEADMPTGSVTMESLMKEYKALSELSAKVNAAEGVLRQLESASAALAPLKYKHDTIAEKTAQLEAIHTELTKVAADLAAAVLAFNQSEYDAAKAAYENAQTEAEKNAAWLVYQPLEAKNKEINDFWMKKSNLENDRKAAEIALESAKIGYDEAAYNSAKAAYDAAVTAAGGKSLDQLRTEVNTLNTSYAEASRTYYQNQFTYTQNAAANDVLSGLKAKADTAQSQVDTLTKEVAEGEKAMQTAAETLTKANADKTAAQAEMDRVENFRSYENLTEQIKKVTAQKTEAEERLAKAEAVLNAGSAENEKAVADQLAAKQKEIDEAKKKLANAKAEAEKEAETARLDKMQYDIELKQLQDQVAKQEEEVNRLMTLETDGKIEAPAAGVIASLPYGVGKEAAANSVVATITLSDAGYTMECTVSAQQAAQIRVGDTGEIQYYYWGETPKAKVVNIQSAQGSMGQSRVVTLEITGQVESGTNLTVLLGGRNESYDAVIPSSAIREDQNGKFVLIVTSKSTPLGNRYKAKRVEVEVLASDAVNSAVSGEISGQYVITHSEKPISSGDAVRLSEE